MGTLRTGGWLAALVLMLGVAGAWMLPLAPCPNCDRAGRVEYDIDQEWCLHSGCPPVVDAQPGWTAPCSRCRTRGRVTIVEWRRGPKPRMKAAAFSADEVLSRFTSRAPDPDQKQYLRMRYSSRTVDHMRATELALKSLSSEELINVGITQSFQDGAAWWAVCWSDDSAATGAVMERVLAPLKIQAIGSMGHGRAGWYVRREQFFDARRELLASPEFRTRPVLVVTPLFRVD